MKLKKSFFQRTYNLNLNLLLLAVLAQLVVFVCEILNSAISGIHFSPVNPMLRQIDNTLFLSEHFANTISISLFIILLTLITIEFARRIMTDSLWNYFKSVYQTERLRYFLKQNDDYETVMYDDKHPTLSKKNTIVEAFNQSVSKCTIDIRKNSIVVHVKYPRSQQAQALLKEIEPHLLEEISSRNSSYYFSNQTREGSNLWICATKR